MKTELIALIVASVAFVWAFWYVLGRIHESRVNQVRECLRRQRKTRINAKAPEHGFIFAPGQAIELNAEALPEVIQIAPFGRWPTRDKKAVQVFNAESAEQVISWFNFWPRRLARLARLNAIKVWVGHPDFAPKEWPERIELGSIVELNADEHGLNAKIEWNADALAHVTKHKFPSVAWDCEINGDGTETPAMLWSVGMWHKPNIKSVQPVINAADDMEESEAESGQPDAAETEKEIKHQKEETPMLKNIMASLVAAGIVKETDDENSILGAIGSMISSLAWKREETQRQAAMASQMRTALNALADVAELPDEALPEQTLTQLNAVITDRDAKAATIAELNAKISTLTAERITRVVDHAIETGRASKADAPTLQAELNADFDGALAKLNERKVQLNAKPLNIGRHKPQVMETQERTTRLNAWISAHMEAQGCSYDAAWNASLSAPETKGIHEAVAAADAARGNAAD